MTSRCSRRRRYTTCKKKRSCKWVKHSRRHKGYCKKKSRSRKHTRQRGGTPYAKTIRNGDQYLPPEQPKEEPFPKGKIKGPWGAPKTGGPKPRPN